MLPRIAITQRFMKGLGGPDIRKLRHVRSATILLPNCSVRSRTGQHLAKAMLENEQLIETCWYGIVREVIAVAEFRVRCFQPLSHLSG